MVFYGMVWDGRCSVDQYKYIDSALSILQDEMGGGGGSSYELDIPKFIF